jgi:hypothetical protein
MSTFSDKAKQIIGTVAPILGTAIGGPFGALAGGIISKLCGNGDTAAAEAAITSGDPDILLKLKQADNDFQIQLKQLGISEDKLAYDDTANARAREMAVKDNTPRTLAYLYTAGFFAVLAGQFWIVLSHVQLDPTALRLIDTTTGVLFAMMLGCKEYYFGSSAGSKDKDLTIATIAKGP